MTISNVIMFPRPHRDDPDAVKREVRKRLGRERLTPTPNTSIYVLGLVGVIRGAMGSIAMVTGTDEMLKLVEQDLAAWKVRSCTNE